MPLFCNICNNLLNIVTTSNQFYFKCTKCYIIYQAQPNDSLRYEDMKGTDLIIYNLILKNAGQDPVNPKVKKKCLKCSNDIIKQVRLGEEMHLINVCPKCNHQWIEGTE